MSEARFLKDFSKQQHATERSQKAKEIIEARKLAREAKAQKPEGEASHAEKGAEYAEAVAKLEELGKHIEELHRNLEDMREERFGEIRNFYAIWKAKRQLAEGERRLMADKPSVEALKRLVDEGQLHIEELERRITDPEHVLASFYDKEKQAWENAPISEEDVEKHFSAEHLASLSMEDYVLLLKRFPSEMVTHVSRRGIRDHVGFMYHTTGQDEFHDSFDKMLDSGRLQSALAIKLEQGAVEDLIEEYLELGKANNRSEAMQKLQDALEKPGYRSVADAAAVHVATEEVADIYYGAETKNEVFVAYPSALIASEYLFNGSLTDTSGDRSRNDTWIWMKEEEGIPLDAGIVFLPKDTKVDSETGSRYALDANMKPIVEQQRIDALVSLAKREDFAAFMFEEKRRRERREQGTFYAEMLRHEEITKRLQEEFGVEDPRIAKMLLEYAGADIADSWHGPYMKDKDEQAKMSMVASSIERHLRKEHLYFKDAENAVPAEEFWKEYFSQHPHRKPKHLVMYEGGNPSEALHAWRKEHGLVKTAKELGVDLERKKESHERPGESTDEVTAGARFQALAVDIINKRFPEDTPVPPPDFDEPGFEPPPDDDEVNYQ